MDHKEEYLKALHEAKALCEKAEEEKRDFTAEEREQVVKLVEAAREHKAEYKKAAGDEALRQAVLDLAGVGNEQPKGRAGQGGTIGQMFVNSPEFKNWWAKVAPAGRLPEQARGIVSPPVEFKGLLGRKELIVGDSDTSAGAFVETDYTRIYEAIGRYPFNVLDLINRRTTMSDLVHFVRQTYQVTQAAVVPEANVTDYSGATGEESGEKPEGRMRWEPVTAEVKTIAVWIPATKRALADVAQLRGIIDQELRDDLNEELEDQVINGDGVGENFTGVVNTAGILTQAWNTDILTTARQAITTLEVTGRSRATAWLINPADWETVELTTDGAGRYYYAGPQARGPAVLWGVPVVTSPVMTEGQALLGDWRKAVIWDRERASIQVSDSHEDFFIRNMVAILAELRAAFAVIRPTGFVLVDMDSGS